MKNHKRNFSKNVYTNAKALQQMREANIIHFLLWYNDEMIMFQDGSYRLVDDKSVVLFNNLCYDHSKKRFDKALHTLDFVTYYLCGDDFNKARKILFHFLKSDKAELEELAISMHLKAKTIENETFSVDKDAILSFDRSLVKWIFGYLYNERRISRNLIAELINRQLIAFESNGKNILFLTYDDNENIVSVEKKGTYRNKKFAQTISKESDIPFIYINDDAKIDDVISLYVFESTIDLLSYITINDVDSNSVYISTRGVAKINCILPILQKYKRVKYIDVCADNDTAGSFMFNDIVAKHGAKYVINPEFPVGAKDWNEYLVKTTLSNKGSETK